MKPVLLIAANFVREQFWPIVVMMVLIAAMGTTVFLPMLGEDFLALVQMVGGYILAFGFFFGISALRNELRSRRILAVLSKGITRGQYLAGLLLGIFFVVGIFCGATGIAMAASEHVQLPANQIIVLICGLLSAALTCASLALLFSVILPPFPAASGTGLTLVLPWIIDRSGAWRTHLSPYGVFDALAHLDAYYVNIGWATVVIGFAESAVIWAIAASLFAGKDVAVALD